MPRWHEALPAGSPWPDDLLAELAFEGAWQAGMSMPAAGAWANERLIPPFTLATTSAITHRASWKDAA
jgi:hypothetical protein